MVHPCDVVMWQVPYQRIIFNVAASRLTFTLSELFVMVSWPGVAGFEDESLEHSNESF